MPQVVQNTAKHCGAPRLPEAAPLLGAVLLRSIERVLHRARGWSNRSREREALGELDDRLLKDIGVSREAAAKEAARPFWR
jgi:uncharacterized protein YjiS (DUF1127 family)